MLDAFNYMYNTLGHLPTLCTYVRYLPTLYTWNTYNVGTYRMYYLHVLPLTTCN